MKLAKSLTTVTPLSKRLALILFLILPIGGFFLGRFYEKSITASQTAISELQASLNKPKISEGQAFLLVRNQPEVEVWFDNFNGPEHTSRKTGGRPGMSLENKTKDTYVIRVFESMADHDVTFSFFEVNTQTGNVAKLAT